MKQEGSGDGTIMYHYIVRTNKCFVDAQCIRPQEQLVYCARGHGAIVCLSVCLTVCLLATSRKTTNGIFMKMLQKCIFGQKRYVKIGSHPHLDPDLRIL